MTDLNPYLLALGQPGLDEGEPIRGLVAALIISLPLWFAIGWVIERVVTWWVAL